MARPKMFRRSFVMRWTPLEETLVGYYARRHGKDQSSVVRSMIRKFARADTSMDLQQLKRHFEEHVFPEIKTDPELAAEATTMLEEFLAEKAG